MKYSTFFKFVAVILCAATLLGMVGSAAGLLFLTELGSKSVEEQYAEQLESHALNYALSAGEVFASREWGGAPGRLIDHHVGYNWERTYFDWARAGYVIRDAEGNVLHEKALVDDSGGVDREYTFPMMGRYMNVVNTAPYTEFAPEAAGQDTGENTRVTVMPAQGSTPVHAIIVDYTDGSRQEWHYDGTQRGSLEYEGGSVITFLSNVGELPMGDGWYPNHILFADSGGNSVYEAYADNLVVLGSSLDGSTGMIEWYLPGETVTTAAPVGITYTEGEYTAYDAIPAQGVTVAQLNVTYGNVEEGDTASEGIASPGLIGTIFHDYQGNAEFHSNEPMTMDVQDSIITRISFLDSQQNLIFEASCPGGVGILSNDENGYLVFRGTMPGTGVPAETEPEITEEDTVAATEAATVPVLMTVTAGKDTMIYNMPNLAGIVLEIPEEGLELKVIQQKAVDGKQWGLTEKGWILLPEETPATARTLGEPVQDRNIYAKPGTGSDVLGTLAEGQEPEIIRQQTLNGMNWGLTKEGWILLGQAEEEAGIPEAAAEAIPAETVFPETQAEAADSTAAAAEETVPSETVAETVPPETPAEETLPYPEEEIETAVYYDGQEMLAEYVWETIPDGYTVTVQLAPGALREEFAWTLLRLAKEMEPWLVKTLGICIAVFVLCVVYLCCAAGHKRGSAAVRAGGLNRIPLDLYLVGGGGAAVGLTALAVAGGQYLARNDEQLAILLCGGCAYLVCLLMVGFSFAFVAQIKTPDGFWWRNTFCGWCIRVTVRCGRMLYNLGGKCWVKGKPLAGKFVRWLGQTCAAVWCFTMRTALWLWDTGKRLWRWFWDVMGRWCRWGMKRLGRLFRLLPITWQFLMVGFSLVFFLYIMIRTYKVGYILLGFGLFFAVILYAATAFGILLESARKMSKGDLDTKVDDRMLIGGFKDFAGELNDLAGVAVIAAQKQLKSERMKTELITNVSHDIKTPLTSIINYVDLLQKPHTEAQQEQYLEVLDRQSQRLKKLIDDLMEMSKASTGNMTVEIQRVDAAEAVNQALGEFADKLERSQLMPVFRQPEEQVYMMADGRLVWRVMSNLLGNAVKYALPGTRVYLDLLEMDGKVIISMKNISREELNVNADELLERFVRGDASRNTEGSGLGLNIAKSLMELQKGQLEILVDGDLFKVTLIFPGV